MPTNPDATELLVDYEHYRTGVWDVGYYANGDEIATAINHRKVFAFRFGNWMALAGIALLSLGILWLWGSVIAYGYVSALIPVVIWCGIFLFVGMLSLIAKIKGILLVGSHGIIFRSLLKTKVVPWVVVETIEFFPSGRASNPFKPTILVRRVGGGTMSIIVSRLTSSEFPKDYLVNGIVTILQSYHQVQLISNISITNHIDVPKMVITNQQSQSSGKREIGWATSGTILLFIGVFLMRVAGFFFGLIELLFGLSFVGLGIIFILYGVWGVTHNSRAIPKSPARFAQEARSKPFLSAVLSGLAATMASILIGSGGVVLYELSMHQDIATFTNWDQVVQMQTITTVLIPIMIIWLVFYAISYILYQYKGTHAYLRYYQVHILLTILISSGFIVVFITIYPLAALSFLLILAFFPLVWFSYQLYHLISVERIREKQSASGLTPLTS